MTPTPTATRLLRFGTAQNGTTPPAPPFDPVSLPFSVVFEARTGRRLDTSGSPASLPGDPVAVWQSRATASLEAAQTTFAARPIYQTVGGKPVLRFSADDYLTVPLAADTPGFGDTVTIAACVEAAVTGTYQVIASVGSASELGSCFLAIDNSGRIGMGAFGADFCVCTAAALPPGTGPRTIIARKNGAFASLRINGEEVGVVFPGTTLTARRGPLLIGAALGYNINLNGDVRFVAGAPQTCLTDAECEKIESYCALL